VGPPILCAGRRDDARAARIRTTVATRNKKTSMAGQRLAFGPAIRRSEAVNQHDQKLGQQLAEARPDNVADA
jgi:hypothetical protein